MGDDIYRVVWIREAADTEPLTVTLLAAECAGPTLLPDADMLQAGAPPAVEARVRLQQGEFLYNQERFSDATNIFDALSRRGSEEIPFHEGCCRQPRPVRLETRP